MKYDVRGKDRTNCILEIASALQRTQIKNNFSPPPLHGSSFLRPALHYLTDDGLEQIPLIDTLEYCSFCTLYFYFARVWVEHSSGVFVNSICGPD